MNRGVLGIVSGFGMVALASSAVAGPPTSPTFTKDVAPILYKNCVVCHRPGRGRAHVAHRLHRCAAVGEGVQGQDRVAGDAAVGRRPALWYVQERSQPEPERHRYRGRLG